MTNPLETSEVTPDTDDLDLFNDTFLNKKVEPAKEETPEETSEPEDVDDTPAETPETDEPENTDSDEPEEEEAEKPKPKKEKGRFQERIDEVIAQARNAERERDELKARLEALEKADKAPQKTEAKPAAVEKDDGPTPDDLNEDGSEKYPLGEYDPAFIRDLTRHTYQKEAAAAKAQQEQEALAQRENSARQAIQEQWNTTLEAAVERHEDFLDKTMELEEAFDGLDPGYSDMLVQTIKSLDHGADVLYYFANNLDEAKKFVAMGPHSALLALGEYNAMFKGQPKSETKPSKAPPPPQVNKGVTARRTVAGDTDDLEAFEKFFFSRK